MIEALLLWLSVGAVALLMHYLSRSVDPSEVRTLGVFSFIEDTDIDLSAVKVKSKRHA